MRLIECHKFNELNTALPNIWAEQSACTSPDSDYEVEFSVPEYYDRVVIFIYCHTGNCVTFPFDIDLLLFIFLI